MGSILIASKPSIVSSHQDRQLEARRSRKSRRRMIRRRLQWLIWHMFLRKRWIYSVWVSFSNYSVTLKRRIRWMHHVIVAFLSYQTVLMGTCQLMIQDLGPTLSKTLITWGTADLCLIEDHAIRLYSLKKMGKILRSRWMTFSYWCVSNRLLSTKS